MPLLAVTDVDVSKSETFTLPLANALSAQSISFYTPFPFTARPRILRILVDCGNRWKGYGPSHTIIDGAGHHFPASRARVITERKIGDIVLVCYMCDFNGSIIQKMNENFK